MQELWVVPREGKVNAVLHPAERGENRTNRGRRINEDLLCFCEARHGRVR